MDKKTLLILEAAAKATPDPGRSMRNLERFVGAIEGGKALGKSGDGQLEAGLAGLRQHLDSIARLFSSSQFLANHALNRPGDLIWSVEQIKTPVTRQRVLDDARDSLGMEEAEPLAMDRMRLFKRRWLMLVTLRDLMGEAGLEDSMQELTDLAEAMIEVALDYAYGTVLKRHGEPPGGGNDMAVIALGKLGGMELNYSSDVDIMFVYLDGEGRTTGVETPSGTLMGRVSLHEFYVKVAELTTSMLHRGTDEGIVYRVDLRLRPGGQKGELAMPLSAYKRYYETLGRTWERMALIRARSVAGEPDLGRAFLSVVEHFVWHRPADLQEIEEIRALKKKIDSSFTRDDIKRGYGGIREAEFFVQTFQMIYGSETRALRSYKLMQAVEGLRRLGMVPSEELERLAGAYLYFRRLEHYLQMLDDLQTYRLPSGEVELAALARKMGFESTVEFLSDLRLKRMGVKDMYNSLLGTHEDAHSEARALMDEQFSDGELKGYLAFKGTQDLDSALRSFKGIRDMYSESHMLAERASINHGIPHLLDLALREPAPERALRGLEGFFSGFGLKEAYLSALEDEKGILTRGMIRMFAMSTELTRLFLSGPEHLNWLVESMPIRKSLRRQREEISRLLKGGAEPESRLMKYKSMEWVRLGMLFTLGVVDIYDLSRYLSHLADALSAEALKQAMGPGGRGMCIMAMGKHGGRELTFGSDLDVVFVGSGPDAAGVASSALRTLTSYSGLGALYEVDTRLRPDGNKGELVKDLEGYRKYYLEHAQPWEVQALLKARPVAGDPMLAEEFMSMAREVLMSRGQELTRAFVRDMRARIVRELSRESDGFDIKLGPGGMEEIEFYVQWLQLSNIGEHPSLLVQDVRTAMDRLVRLGVMKSSRGITLSTAYFYYKKLSALLRLNSEKAASAKSPIAHAAAEFMGHESATEMMECLQGYRETVLELIEEK